MAHGASFDISNLPFQKYSVLLGDDARLVPRPTWGRADIVRRARIEERLTGLFFHPTLRAYITPPLSLSNGNAPVRTYSWWRLPPPHIYPSFPHPLCLPRVSRLHNGGVLTRRLSDLCHWDAK